MTVRSALRLSSRRLSTLSVVRPSRASRLVARLASVTTTSTAMSITTTTAPIATIRPHGTFRVRVCRTRVAMPLAACSARGLGGTATGRGRGGVAPGACAACAARAASLDRLPTGPVPGERRRGCWRGGACDGPERGWSGAGVLSVGSA